MEETWPPPLRYVIQDAEGRRYAVTPTAFADAALGPAGQSYQALGWQIVCYEDGSPYVPEVP